MSFAVCHVSKIKLNNYGGSLRHNLRDFEPSEKNQNINYHLSYQNVIYGPTSVKELTKKIEDVKREVRSTRSTDFRKDAVFEEIVLSFSPDFDCKGQELKKWYDTNINFLQKKYGDNFISAQLHIDEKTPHIHAYILPVSKKEIRGKIEKTFCHKDFFDKKDLKELQNEYPKFMQDHGFDLKRGIEDRAVKHTNQKDFSKITQSVESYQEQAKNVNFFEISKQIDTSISEEKIKDEISIFNKEKSAKNIKKYIDDKVNSFKYEISEKAQNFAINTFEGVVADKVLIEKEKTQISSKIREQVKKQSKEIENKIQLSFKAKYKPLDDKINKYIPMIEVFEKNMVYIKNKYGSFQGLENKINNLTIDVMNVKDNNDYLQAVIQSRDQTIKEKEKEISALKLNEMKLNERIDKLSNNYAQILKIAANAHKYIYEKLNVNVDLLKKPTLLYLDLLKNQIKEATENKTSITSSSQLENAKNEFNSFAYLEEIKKKQMSFARGR